MTMRIQGCLAPQNRRMRWWPSFVLWKVSPLRLLPILTWVVAMLYLKVAELEIGCLVGDTIFHLWNLSSCSNKVFMFLLLFAFLGVLRPVMIRGDESWGQATTACLFPCSVSCQHQCGLCSFWEQPDRSIEQVELSPPFHKRGNRDRGNLRTLPKFTPRRPELWRVQSQAALVSMIFLRSDL